jgi:hypothetical protein
MLKDSTILFTRDRSKGTQAQAFDRENERENIYISFKKDTSWTKARRVAFQNESVDYAIVGISWDETTVFISAGSGNGDLYSCNFDTISHTLGSPNLLSKMINWDYSNETSAFLDREDVMFCSSDAGPTGDQDIYSSKNDLALTGITTNNNEQGIFIDADTIWWSSDRTDLGSKGGFDIFRGVLNKERTAVTDIQTCTELNSSKDDMVHGDPRRCWVSNRDGSWDIFDISYPPKTPAVEQVVASDIQVFCDSMCVAVDSIDSITSNDTAILNSYKELKTVLEETKVALDFTPQEQVSIKKVQENLSLLGFKAPASFCKVQLITWTAGSRYDKGIKGLQKFFGVANRLEVVQNSSGLNSYQLAQTWREGDDFGLLEALKKAQEVQSKYKKLYSQAPPPFVAVYEHDGKNARRVLIRFVNGEVIIVDKGKTSSSIK